MADIRELMNKLEKEMKEATTCSLKELHPQGINYWN